VINAWLELQAAAALTGSACAALLVGGLQGQGVAGAVAGVGEVRLEDVFASLSLATDLGNGFLLEKALRNSVLATRLAAAAGMEPRLAHDAYFVAMLRVYRVHRAGLRDELVLWRCRCGARPVRVAGYGPAWSGGAAGAWHP
jgi:hypothetical protein